MLWALLLLALVRPDAARNIEFIAASEEIINGLPLNSPQCLAVNPIREEFLVADALNNRIVIFDTLGRAVFDFALGADRVNPFGVAVNSNEEILVSAMDCPEIWIFDYNGHYLETFYLDKDIFPGRLLFNPGDTLYLVDRAGMGVLELDKAGHETRSFKTDSTSTKPTGLCFDNAGNLILISRQGIVLTAFDPGDGILYRFGKHGRPPEDFSHPTSAICDKDGVIWVIDTFRHHIKRFGPDHDFIDIIGERGTNIGDFYFPADLKLTPSGKLGVLEKGIGRLQVFRVNNEN